MQNYKSGVKIDKKPSVLQTEAEKGIQMTYLNNLSAVNQTVVYIIVAVIAVLLILLAIFIHKKRTEPKYFAKEAFLTPTEIEYYNILSALVGDNYLLFPQINLATVVDKEYVYNSRTDLFRNIDFGVFDYNFKPILMIEINDNSHFRKDRIERDQKVSTILKKAKLPLMTLWVKDGIDINEIRYKLSKYIKVN